MSLTIERAIHHIAELANDAVKMRKIIDNQDMNKDLRYRAAVIEEGQLELIKKYVEKVEEIKLESVKDVRFI